MCPAKQGIPGEAVARGVKMFMKGNFTLLYWAYLGKQWEVCLMDKRKLARRMRYAEKQRGRRRWGGTGRSSGSDQ